AARNNLAAVADAAQARPPAQRRALAHRPAGHGGRAGDGEEAAPEVPAVRDRTAEEREEEERQAAVAGPAPAGGARGSAIVDHPRHRCDSTERSARKSASAANET